MRGKLSQVFPGPSSWFRTVFIGLAFLLAGFRSGVAAEPVHCVIHISADGLRPDAVTALGPSNAPNFYRLRAQGAFTDNARADYDYTVTLPNHTCQLTGYPVVGEDGHSWTWNIDTAEDVTLASNKGRYIPGVFDVAHDNGLRTGLFASKSKFSIFVRSWDAVNGALDAVVPDYGRNKIDVSVLDTDTDALVGALITNMTAQPFGYVFLHLANPDGNGHSYGWDITPGSAYSDAVKQVDTYLGMLLTMIDSAPALSNHTIIVLTADHGGTEFDHNDETLAVDYTVPFYVWGPAVASGADLYIINPVSRKNPGMERPDYSGQQPVRNGDVANVALKLLGLGPVPGSTINVGQNLSVGTPLKDDFRLSIFGNQDVFTFSTLTNVWYEIDSRADVAGGGWSPMGSSIAGNGGMVTNARPHPTGALQEFFRLRAHL